MTSDSKDAPGGNAQIILVTGATGNQGGAAAARLLTAGWRVRALTRDPASRAAPALAGSGAEVTAGDLDDPGSLRAATDGSYGVFRVQQGAPSSPPVRFEDEVVGCALARPSGPRQSCGSKDKAEPGYDTVRATFEANFYYTIGPFAYTINDTFYSKFKPGPNPPGRRRGSRSRVYAATR